MIILSVDERASKLDIFSKKLGSRPATNRSMVFIQLVFSRVFCQNTAFSQAIVLCVFYL